VIINKLTLLVGFKKNVAMVMQEIEWGRKQSQAVQTAALVTG
jgi:hypothetical protein